MTPSTASQPPSLEQVYTDQQVRLIRLAYLLTGSREQAEDVVQSVFASAHERWHTIEDAVPYLKRAVINASADVHRRRFRSRLELMTEPVTHLPEIDDTWHVIVGLPTRQRAVVVLHFYEDLALVDIAKILGAPAATVRSDLRRALARLKEEL